MRSIKMSKKRAFTILLEIVLVIVIALVWHIKSSENKKDSDVSGEIEIHIIDVGQGDSALIKTKDGNILIDAGTGKYEDELIAYLEAEEITAFKYCIRMKTTSAARISSSRILK